MVGARNSKGELARAISDAMVLLHRSHYGRGPASAHTMLIENAVLCVLTDVYTRMEKGLLRIGKQDSVREARQSHQRAVERELIEPVERLTGRRVASFASSVTFEPDQAIEIFLLADDDIGGIG